MKKSNLYQKGKKATVWIGTLEQYGLGGAEDMPKLIQGNEEEEEWERKT